MKVGNRAAEYEENVLKSRVHQSRPGTIERTSGNEMIRILNHFHTFMTLIIYSTLPTPRHEA